MKMSRTGKAENDRFAKTNRRRFVAVATAGIGVAMCGSGRNGGRQKKAQRVLERGNKIDIDGKAEEIIEKASRLGHEYEKKYGGCAQCVVAALQDAIPFVPRDRFIFRAASCLDGGATPTGLQNCGAFTGAGMVIGHLCGRTRAGGEFQGDARFSHDLIRKVYQQFKEQYGSALCQDVRRGAAGDCPKVVATAAKWAAKVLLGEFTDYGNGAEADP
jgi:hypothetical protein